MLKITKAIEKKLANIAKQLPLTTYGVKKYTLQRIDSERVQKTTYGENLHVVNHKNRIKTAYSCGGVEAVKEYINGVAELANSQVNIAVDL